MSKPRKPTGQLVVTDDGSRSWVWEGGDSIDTAQVRALAEDLSLDNTPPEKAPSTLDPYNRGAVQEKKPKRRTLDDMRRLSDQIKTAKHWKREK